MAEGSKKTRTAVESTVIERPRAWLQELPDDILSLIIDLIPLRRDLRSICFSSKTLYRAALPKLYYHLEFTCEEPDFLRGLLCPENAGLQYVRHVTLVADPNPPRHVGHERIDHLVADEVRRPAETILSMLIYMLPKHSLRTMTINIDWPIDDKLMWVLHARQCKLRDLRVDCSNRYETCVRSLPALSELTTLYLRIDKARLSLQYRSSVARSLSDRLKQLQHLEIAVPSQSLKLHPRSREYAEEVKEVLDVFFVEHRSADYQSNGISLQTLRLFGIRFSNDLVNALTKIVNFKALQTLELMRCQHTEFMINAVLSCGSMNEKLASLRDLIIVEDVDRCPQPISFDGRPLNTFINSFSGLSTLIVLSYQNPKLTVTWDALSFHAATLTTVVLDRLQEEEYLPGGDDKFKDVLPRLTRLRQLGIVSPHLDLGGEEPFLKGLEASYPHKIDWNHFDGFCATVARLPSLRTLCLLNPPTIGPGPLNSAMSYYASFVFVTEGLNRIANATFEWIPQLQALGIGVSSPSLEFDKFDKKSEQWSIYRHESPPRYARGNSIDPSGNVKVCALQVNGDHIQDYEPYSDILKVNNGATSLLRYGDRRLELRAK